MRVYWHSDHLGYLQPYLNINENIDITISSYEILWDLCMQLAYKGL